MRKLKSLEDIKIGAILVKYPTDGTVVDDYKFEPGNQSRYQVYNIKPSMVELQIPDDEVPHGGIEIANMIVTGTVSNPPVLNKTPDELLSEGIWWI